MSGGCYGVISPHVTVVTVDWRDAVAGSLKEPKLVVGRSRSKSFAAEDIGRIGQIQCVSEAVRAAMADAGLTNTRDVKAVLVEGPASPGIGKRCHWPRYVGGERGVEHGA